ncbi:MAG: Arm DNA-binding domain-containing protein, partial [Pseudomonadota bacterium]|nr:Arm DNA-binding domain-containing protein [Pseudomonadota bacterium]
MKLNNTAIKNAKPLANKDLRLSDGEGLYLLVKKNGTKCWRLDYRFNGKTRVFSMGVYPEVPLKEAREKKQKARKLLNDGKDPNREKKIQKIKRQQAIAHS